MIMDHTYCKTEESIEYHPDVRAAMERKHLAHDGEPFYEVEAILDSYELNEGNRKYLIRWAGFCKIYDTWEPAEHLYCPEKLVEFLRNEQGAHERTKVQDEKTSAEVASQTSEALD